MTPTTTNAELDSLIEEITVDCNDEDEVLIGFEGAFDENASLPCPGNVVGEPVEVLSVRAGDQRRGLTATCQRAGRSYEIALLDINIDADPTDRRLPPLGHRLSDATRLHPRRRDRHRRKPVLRDQHRPGPRPAPSSAHQRTGVDHRQHQADRGPRPRGIPSEPALDPQGQLSNGTLKADSSRRTNSSPAT